MCLCLVTDADDDEDCARLKSEGIVKDMFCSNEYKTICQRDANLGKQYIS